MRKILKRSIRYPMGPTAGGQAIPKEYYEEKIVVKADTLEELAEKCKIEKDELLKTIQKWNEYCKEGKDLEWRRGESKYDQYTSPSPSLLLSSHFLFSFLV
jgi:3-oxosteroid 1-dehydrogenase